ncbi:hypothetical protein [Streptomyces stramineus]
MTQRVVQRRSRSVRHAAAGSAMALVAGLALVAGTAGQATAIPAAAGAKAAESCDSGQNTAASAAADTARTDAPARATAGTTAQKLSYHLPAQAPIGLWTQSSLTLRAPVSKGTVRLDVSSRGFGTDSLLVQRYVPETRRWTDLKSDTSGGPGHGVFTFPLTAAASAARPHTVALRLQDLDRPGTFTVTASVDDGKGRTHRAAARHSTATRPTVSVSGWRTATALTRGGPAQPFTVTVKNTTDRAYPALNASYFAFGEGKGHALAPKDLKLEQYRPGAGWKRVPLVAGGCDPGMSAALHPAAKAPLAPGATAVYTLRVAVASSAPREVTSADAGVSVGNADVSFFSRELPFTLKGGK